MSIVRYREDEIPPATPEREAELRALAERLANDEYEFDFSDIPKLDEFDFKYYIPAGVWNVLTHKERSELGRKLLAAKEADRTAAREAKQKAERVPVEA